MSRDGSQGKLRLAIVGAGFIARARHVPTWKRHTKQVEVVAVCDANLNNASALANEFGGAGAFADLGKALKEVRPNVVDICTPPGTHAALAKVALEAGCHVLIEKPMALSSADCRNLVQTAQKHNRVLCVVHNMHFYPPMLKARRLLEQGAIGDFVSMRVLISNPTTEYAAKQESWTHQLPGGILGETGPHVVYLSLPFIGRVLEVSASARKHSPYPWCERDDFTVELAGERGNSSIRVLHCTNQWAGEVDLYATEGILKVDLQAMTLTQYQRQKRTHWAVGKSRLGEAVAPLSDLARNSLQVATGSFQSGHENLIAQLVQGILQGGTSPVDPEQGVQTVEVMERIVQELDRVGRSAPSR